MSDFLVMLSACLLSIPKYQTIRFKSGQYELHKVSVIRLEGKSGSIQFNVSVASKSTGKFDWIFVLANLSGEMDRTVACEIAAMIHANAIIFTRFERFAKIDLCLQRNQKKKMEAIWRIWTRIEMQNENNYLISRHRLTIVFRLN